MIGKTRFVFFNSFWQCFQAKLNYRLFLAALEKRIRPEIDAGYHAFQNVYILLDLFHLYFAIHECNKMILQYDFGGITKKRTCGVEGKGSCS